MVSLLDLAEITEVVSHLKLDKIQKLSPMLGRSQVLVTARQLTDAVDTGKVH
jgi:hypothetical protein